MAKQTVYKRNKIHHRFPSRTIAIIVGLILIAAATFAYFHYLKPRPTVTVPSEPITQLKHVPAANNGEKKVNSSGSGLNQQTDKDNHGVAPGGVSTNPSQWTVSQSGVITVKQPAQNSLIQSGTSLVGSAGVSQVQYRLVDDQVGVISQGFISVVNGVFSANINFQSHAGTGQLDVFSTDAGGKEINEVQIPVRF